MSAGPCGEFIQPNTEPCDDLLRRERLKRRQPVEIFLSPLELLAGFSIDIVFPAAACRWRPRNLPIPPSATVGHLRGARLERMEQAPGDGPHAMVRLIARVIGVGIETADMLVHEVLSRKLRDRRAVARYAGLTGAPDESGSKRREKGLAKAGNARVRGGMIQLAWRFLLFQKDSALAQWYRTRTEGGRNRKTIIVALARKLLIALWRLVTTGEVPAGVVLRAV